MKQPVNVAAWTSFVIAATFFLFEFVTRIEPSLATAQIKSAYHLTDAGLGAMSSMFFWVYAPMQIVVGLLLDRFGARCWVLLGTLTCAAGVLLFALSSQLVLGQLGRMLTGFGASFAFVSALWLVNHWFAPERFGFLSSVVNAVGMLGTAIGGVALSGLIAQAGWRPVFVGTGLAGLALFAAALVWLREPHSPAATASAPVHEHIGQSLRDVLGSGRVWLIALVGLLYYVPVNVYGGLWGTTELVVDHHLSSFGAETAVSMIFWGLAAGSIAGGWLSDRLGQRKPLVCAGALLCAACYALTLYDQWSAWQLGALLFAAGFFGGPQALTFAMAKEGMPNRLAGTVVAFVNMTGMMAALIFQPLVGRLADATGGNYRQALLLVPACAALAALFGLVIPERRHPEHAPGARQPHHRGDAPVPARGPAADVSRPPPR